MPIICFEGASAVGKTTTSESLKLISGAAVVPEVNLLFKRPQNEALEWYFERQVDRWALVEEYRKSHQLIILDGDLFQPLWYCWAYNFEGWQDLNFMEQFYEPKIRNGIIDFPDLYFIYSTGETELRKRREGDLTRRRRYFETHLKMIEPQRRYFQQMQNLSPNRVIFLEAQSIETNVEFIIGQVAKWSSSERIESEDLFSNLIQWLRENKAY